MSTLDRVETLLQSIAKSVKLSALNPSVQPCCTCANLMTHLSHTSPPRLSISQIVQMNVGFLGLQFSFGLQQSSMSPIYSYLGAQEATLPLLNLAGPITGLLVQPIVGAMSDRTTSRYGRRTPYFLVGAILCSLSLFAMPYSSALDRKSVV